MEWMGEREDRRTEAIYTINIPMARNCTRPRLTAILIFRVRCHSSTGSFLLKVGKIQEINAMQFGQQWCPN